MVLKTIPINLDLEIIEKLREIAYQRHTSISAIVREALNLYLSSIGGGEKKVEEKVDNPRIKVAKERYILNISREAWENNRNVGVKCHFCDTYFHDKPIIMLRKYARHLVQRHGITNTILTLKCGDEILEEIDLDKIEVS